MKYLSIDIEATGLKENDLVIEFAAIAFDSETKKIHEELSFHTLVKCPSYEELSPRLDVWVKEHNKVLIEDAHKRGKDIPVWKDDFQKFLEDSATRKFFNNDKIVLFGKSMNAIDLPFLNRDLGWEWMRKYFSHRTVDFTGTCYNLMDLGLLPPASERGSVIMKFLGLGAVAHDALNDAKNTAKMYLEIINRFGHLPQSGQ